VEAVFGFLGNSLIMIQLLSVQIELTSRCNERCVHCYIPHETKNRDMDSGLLFSLLDQCRNMGVKQITFSGGEPMLRPGFLQAVSRADWEVLKLRIFSNLTLLADDTVATLKTLNIHEVQASLYSVDPAVHDAVTQISGSCESTKKGIETLVKHDIPVSISCPLMKQNKDSYPGVLDYAKELGIRCVPDTMIMAQSNGGTANLANRLSIEEALDVIKYILDNDDAYNARRFLPGYDSTNDALPCVQNIGADSVCVNANGEAVPAPAWQHILGDLNKQTLRHIWENSPELKKIRAAGLDDFPQCRSCPDIQFCGMSFEGNANENPAGNPFIIQEHICVLARRMRELVHGWHKKNARKQIETVNREI
jgi:radical SAM protein with 4Fe4S-binding SPASM domain